MIEILPQSTSNVVALRVNGKLVHEDYQQFIPQLEQVIQQYGSMRCYCEMTNFEGITWQALMDEVQFDVKHCGQIERCAIVSDSAWNQWMTDFTKMVFHNAQIECFTSRQTEEAWNWVTDQNEYATSSCGCNQTTQNATGSQGGSTTGGTNRQTTGKQNTNANSCGTKRNSCGYTGGANQNTFGNTTDSNTPTT
ncbi:MAG TPA: hypothetical protein DD670_08195 [Planctomycetaceae bacterium]|nr:hypothetical protein [Planctomycetaceae bacterium]